MNRRTAAMLIQFIAACSLSGFTGCAHKTAVPAAYIPVTQSSETVKEDGGEQKDIQSLNERQLVLLFRSLLLMDKKPELILQKEQVARILPLIRESVNSGEMSALNRKQIIELLTKEQKSFLAGAADRLQRTAFAARVSLEDQQESKDGTSHNQDGYRYEGLRGMAQTNAERRRTVPGNATDDGKLSDKDLPTMNEKSVEQQLVELLESKLN